MFSAKNKLIHQPEDIERSAIKRPRILGVPEPAEEAAGELVPWGSGGLQGLPAMSLQCSECKGNICDNRAGENLSFCVDGTSVHLVMGASKEGREGIGFGIKEVPANKQPNENNPYRSVAYVLCANRRPDNGQQCNKKVGGVKCYPPLSDNQLIFFQQKALLVDHQHPKSWKNVRESSLRKVKLLPAGKEEEERQFTPRQWPTLRKSLAGGSNDPGHGGGGMDLTRSTPRGYQEELFDAVMECERNSLVYLPTGLGKTLVAAMVLKQMLDWNPERQAYFLVETTALAMQQTTRLQNELGGTVKKIEMLVGSSLQAFGGKRGKIDHGLVKLECVRDANIVVATAGAFEHCMCKRYIDPDAICCVVLDEAHHCGKEHPFNRVARSFLTMKAFPSVQATPDRAKEFPKLVALTASPAGELSVHDTTVRINQLLDRLEADLAAPVQHLQEVKSLTPSVDLELLNVTATASETTLLGCLEKLVLSRLVGLAPEASEAHAQAQSLLDSLGGRMRGAAAAATASTAAGADVPRKDDAWVFPNKFFTALCQRALSAGGAEQREGWWESDGTVMDEGSGGGGGGGGGEASQLHSLMNLSFAVDEIGGEAIWQRALEELDNGWTSGSSSSSGEGNDFSDPELEETIGVLKENLSAVATVSGSDGGSAAASGGDAVRRAGGSKLAKIAWLLEEHKRACDASGKRFSALVFVSRRELALATPAMLEEAKPFVKAQSIVGLSEMTLNQQRRALASFQNGLKNVLVSTSVCGEGIDVPACALVVCASLPSSGTELVQLRGRIRSKENECRFVGLTRTAGAADKAHVKSICLREQNMLEAIRSLSGGGSSGSDVFRAKAGRGSGIVLDGAAAAATAAATASLAGAPRTGVPGVCPPVNVPTSSGSAASPSQTVTRAQARAAQTSPGAPSPTAVAPSDPHPPGKELAPADEVTAPTAKGKEGRGGGVAPEAATAQPDDNPWKVSLPVTLSPAARRYAATYLATCVRQALQRNPDQMARCTLNSAAQLAQTIKPVFEYDERKLKGSGVNTCFFEARCIVTSRLEELAGLILVKEAKGSSIKAAREGAAVKVYMCACEL
ncbi:DEAD box helicase [Ectocarpus siliculosus]|uniref:DEAD box helicase n=1 Tax=Ectocarpus siliculosus TaxID=2880 RepID=D8LU32_ECTSI|nr:DEAD box helicase [Ectocarpus siliculosus]|eukprot:CBN78074.1 DEAD box helicase [Ectocarpus siliculosus]